MPGNSRSNQIFPSKTLILTNPSSNNNFNKSFALRSIGVCACITFGIVFLIMPKIVAKKAAMLVIAEEELKNNRVDVQAQVAQDLETHNIQLQNDISAQNKKIQESLTESEINLANNLNEIEEKAKQAKEKYDQELPHLQAQISQINEPREALKSKHAKAIQDKEAELKAIIDSRNDEIHQEKEKATKKLTSDVSKSFFSSLFGFGK